MYLGRVAGAVALILAATLMTQEAHGVCTGPPQLTAAMKAHPTAENTVLLGSWFASHQQFACAADTFHAGIAHSPGSAQLHYLYAVALVAQKKSPDAVPELQKAIQLDAGQLNPHLLLASIYAGMNQQVEAAKEWQKALTIDPKNEQAIYGITGALMDDGDYSDVVALLGPAPRTERFAIRLSQALAMMNEPTQANAVLTEAMQINPHSVPLARALAVVLVHQRRRDEAIAVLLKAVQEHPSDVSAAIELYQLYCLNGYTQQAATMKDRLLAARPHDRDVLYLSGVIERSQGHYDVAKKLLEESVAVDPEFAYSRYNLGATLVILHEWQPAKENLEKAIALGIEQSEVYYELAKALNGLGEHDQAQEALAKYQTVKNDSERNLEAIVAAGQGDKDIADGNAEEAIVAYRQAIQTLPNVAYYHFKLSIALDKHGDIADEKKELQEAVRLNPKFSAAQGALGYLLSQEGDVDGSIEHFKLALATAPRWTDAWINLAAELAMSAQYAEARQAVATALQLDPKNERAHELSDQLARDPNAQQAKP